MSKKTWKKPKLLVLARGGPEESVLQVCKYQGNPGPQNVNNDCLRLQGYNVTPCQTRSSS
ncbi:MAG: hypothetical protein JRJ66_12900 [Deltaproteobacteria bacterium]|nr:hypothetical protein [Deltaproteobacteria bacterium]MBW2046076.1 hypothetical protein [Deltaproteobacteria bacterium]MBW2299645.1 hypothetical protein [Deltaproteobacteria bacterium]